MRNSGVTTFHYHRLLAMVIFISILFTTGCQSETPTPTEAPPEEPGSTIAQTPTPTPSQTPLPPHTETATLPPTTTATVASLATDTPTYTPFYTKTPTPLPDGVELVHLRTEDSLELLGFLHTPLTLASDSVAVVLGHELGANHGSWEPFASRLVEQGYTTLTFDFRGHGASPGTRDFATLGLDAAAAIKFLTLQGFDRVVCIGASMGGTACLAAAAGGYEIAGLGMLSSPRNIPGGPVLVSKSDFRAMTFPKVFMIAEEDYASPTFVADFIEMVEEASEPKASYLYPGMAHGTGLLLGATGEEAQEILLQLVETIALK